MVAGGLSTGIYTTNSPEAVRWICDHHDLDDTRWGSLPATLAQTSLSLLTRSSWKKWCRFRSMLTIILEMMIVKYDQGEEQFEPPQSGCSIFWRGEPIIIVKMWITVLTVFAKCHNSTSKIPLWLNWCIQQQSYKITTKKLKQLTLRQGVRMRLGTSPADPWKCESGQMVSEKSEISLIWYQGAPLPYMVGNS